MAKNLKLRNLSRQKSPMIKCILILSYSHYTSDDIKHNIIYDLVLEIEKESEVCMNIIYNESNAENSNICKLLGEIAQLKLFSQMKG